MTLPLFPSKTFLLPISLTNHHSPHSVSNSQILSCQLFPCHPDRSGPARPAQGHSAEGFRQRVSLSVTQGNHLPAHFSIFQFSISPAPPLFHFSIFYFPGLLYFFILKLFHRFYFSSLACPELRRATLLP
jgi:hypothetical protein